ncbi:MAG: hypothetical protein FVQ82_12950 [Planctomycetes bacterium]|nr:hypothetical protein [Planctomycetota bacterium]
MVALNEVKDTDGKVAGAICPGCDEHYMYPAVVEKEPDRYGRQLREVYGWCLKCNVGYEAVQFKNEGKWLTCRCRKYTYTETETEGSKPVPVGGWVQGYSLPDPAPVVVGPGGDFVKQIDIDAEVGKTLRAAVTILNKAVKNLVELMNIAKKRDGAKHD